MSAVPPFTYHFEPDDPTGALSCLSEYGFCVICGLIGKGLVRELKDSIDEHLDPGRSLPQASNKYHITFAEVCEPLWRLVDNTHYWDFICAIHGTSDLCLHRSAAIFRTAGEGMGKWHTDFLGDVETPRNANQILNRFPHSERTLVLPQRQPPRSKRYRRNRAVPSTGLETGGL